MTEYTCTIKQCGRKFPQRESLEEHIMRRHKDSLEGVMLPKIRQRNLQNQPEQQQQIQQQQQQQVQQIPVHNVFKRRSSIDRKGSIDRRISLEKKLIQQDMQVIQKTRVIPSFAGIQNSDEKKNMGKKIRLKMNPTQPIQPIQLQSLKKLPAKQQNIISQTPQQVYQNDDDNNEKETYVKSVQVVNNKKIVQEVLTFEDDNSTTQFTNTINTTNIDSQPSDIDFLFDEIEDEELDYISYEQIKVTPKDIQESLEKLNKEYIIQKSGFDKLETIQSLVLREEGLCVFEKSNDFDPDNLIGLEYLSFSHNRLINLTGVGQCLTLLELNINYNNIEDLTPLENCPSLKILYASHNKISSVKSIKNLDNLEILSLYDNKLQDFDQIIEVFSNLNQLKEIELDRNPCTKRFSYKYDLLWTLKIEKLDGEIITDLDYELSKTFKQEVLTQTQQYGINAPLQRPSTAPGKYNPQSSQKNYLKKFKNKLYDPIKNKNSNDINIDYTEKIIQLEKNIEKQQNDKQMMDQQVRENEQKINQLEIDLKNENLKGSMLQTEIKSAFIYEQENLDLKNQLRDYEILLKGEQKSEQQYEQEIQFLNMKIDATLTEMQRLQTDKKQYDQNEQTKNVSDDDSEIEDLLIQNSMNLDSIRQELRNFSGPDQL